MMANDIQTIDPPPLGLPDTASDVYIRVFEELANFLNPAILRPVLEIALADATGVGPTDAEAYDFRVALIGDLPDRLAEYLPGMGRAALLEMLEEVLVDASCSSIQTAHAS